MTLRPSEKSLSPSGNPNNYYTKEQTDSLLNGKANTATTLAGYGITDGANTALSNLSADGQMIVDSQNGTISNCVLEIPQNIKCSIASNVVTLSSGSVLTNTGATYATTTTTANQTYTIDNSLADGNYLLCSNGVAIQAPLALSVTGSGASLPADGSTYTYFFNTTDKLIYKYADGAWSATSYCYPFALVTMSSGVATFAKDSNGNDIIFNGACFVGTAIVTYPNIKGLIPNGLTNGKYASKSMLSNALRITQLSAFTGDRILLCNSVGGVGVLYDLTLTIGGYDAKTNTIYRGSGTAISDQMELGVVSMSGGIITDFTIRQPVRTATVEMLDKALGDINTLLAAI